MAHDHTKNSPGNEIQPPAASPRRGRLLRFPEPPLTRLAGWRPRMPEARAKVTVVEAIREGRSLSEAAREAGTSANTVRGWAQQDACFARQLQDAEHERSMREQEQWDRMMLTAIETLTSALRAPESEVPTAMKLRAANTLLRIKESKGKARKLLRRGRPTQDPEHPDAA